jgi:hypothetical protein
MAFAHGRYSGGSINVHTEKRISCVLRCGCRGCCHSVGGRDVECNAICSQLCGAARRASHGAAPHSTARRSPRARSAHKPFGSRARGQQCSASAPGPPYVWLRDRGDVRICNQRRAKSPSESRRYILRAAYRDSHHISKSKHRQAYKNSGLYGCRPEEPEHGSRIDCIDGSQRKAPHFPRGSIARVGERCPPLVYGAKVRGDKTTCCRHGEECLKRNAQPYGWRRAPLDVRCCAGFRPPG